MAFTSRGVIKRLEGAQGSEATAVQWRAVKYVGRIQRGEERPIPGWRWPAGARRPAGAERLISGLERIARGQTRSLVRRNPRRRRNPSSSTAAVQRRASRLMHAITRRGRVYGPTAKMSDAHWKKLAGLHGAAGRAGSVLHRRYRAEDLAPASRARSMDREHALAKAIERRRRSHKAGAKLAQLQAAHRRALAYLRRQGWETVAEVERQYQARSKRRRRNPMAKRKRTPAQKAAFRRMIAGLHRHQARKNPRRKKRARARRRKTTVTVTTNPRRRRRKNSRGGTHMAKHRRRRTRTNPGRRHRRRNPHHHRRHRRRNPGGGMGGIVKRTIAAAVPSMAAGAVVAIADAKLFADKPMGLQVLGKLIMVGGAGYLLRNRPHTAALVMGSIFGTLAYQLAANAAGGMVAPDKTDATKKIAALVYADRRMAALVERNGQLRTQPTLSGMGQAMGEGGTALPTMPIYDPVNLG